MAYGLLPTSFMGAIETAKISAEQVERYLRRTGHADATVQTMSALGVGGDQGAKAYGYGRPLRVTYRAAGGDHVIVLRTMSPDPFNHDRHADRWSTLQLAYDTFADIPRHIKPIDIGAMNEQGELVPAAHGEPFLITGYAEGRLYAADLATMDPNADAPAGAVERAEALAIYLAELHSEAAPRERYARCLRDTVGHGEGIFGLADSFPADDRVLTPERLEALEHRAVAWRWRWRGASQRCRRTHGDFHPFNLLFREGTDFSVLDCSRGAAGEPADDATCLSINYMFWALKARGKFVGPFRTLWNTFWSTYLDRTNDHELLEIAPLFFAWRALVLASPVWYPDVALSVRFALIRFVERLLDGEPFVPSAIDGALS